MAPRQTLQSGPFLEEDPESVSEGQHSNDEEEDQNQESQDPAVKDAQKLVAKYQHSREATRKALEVDHKRRVHETAKRIDELFESRKKKITKSRVDAFVRLAAMNKKRRDIEAAILASMRSLEVHTQNIASEMQAMFTGRIEEIYDPIINT